MVMLTYKPTAVGTGSVTFDYSYTNNAGTSETGTATVDYAATSADNNNVVATPSPAGQIVAVLGNSQTVQVNFTTDDGKTATKLSITSGLSTLPAGWTGPTSFTCASVSTGSGCQLSLTYKPTQTGSGPVVTLNFGYTNNSGAAKTGNVTITYMATVDNAVTYAYSPSGTVNAVVGGNQTVTVTFNSNDGSPATNLQITSGLGASLPAGWSAPGTFTCTPVNPTGNACQLSLTYTPTAYVASGTLQLKYGYNANSGAAQTGSVMIPYTATTNNNVVVTPSPSGTVGAVVNSAAVPVTLTFTTDDFNPATAVTITSGLGTLPAGWTGPASFSCPSASTGTGCQLALAYAPTVNGSGTVSLGYSYLDDSGTAKTSTANITYASIPAALYITDTVSSVVRCTMSGADGSLSSCASVTTGLAAPIGIAFSGKYAYVTPGVKATDVDVCPVNADGTLGTCTLAVPLGLPNALAVSGGYLYVSDASTPYVASCPINNADGSLSACTPNYIGSWINTMDSIAVTATNAYMVDYGGQNLTTCTVSAADGSLSACTQQTLNLTDAANSPNSNPRSAYVYGGNLYVGTNAGTLILPIASDGTVIVNYPCSTTIGTSCTIDYAPAQSPAYGFAFNNGYAYASGFNGGGGIGICTLETSGIVDKCTSSFTGTNYGGLAVH
jgi:hypothetical protein